jgi:hypothetical protein
MIGRTGSWIWWALGCLCALVFVRNAPAQENAAVPEYGVRVQPPAGQPLASEDQRKAAERLVDAYLGPVAEAAPTDEQKTAMEAALAGLASVDFAARETSSARLIKIGPAALGALRGAAGHQDPEVANRAGAAIVEIENAARRAIIDDLKKNPAALRVISARQTEARTAQFTAMRESDEVRKAGREKEAAAKAAEVVAARAKSAALTALMTAAFPGSGMGERVAPVYGIRVPVE